MDKCKNCIIRGDLVRCKDSPCQIHASWYADEQRKEIDRLRKERDEAMKALCSLTPGGSEFHNNIKACVEYLTNLKTRQHEYIKKNVKRWKKSETNLNTARQMYCQAASYFAKKEPQEIADTLGWDCFRKE